MVDVLADPELYTFIGGSPPRLEELESRYRAQVAGPPTGDQVWHNWILRLAGSEIAVGCVQATVIGATAGIAWLVGTRWQGQGFATEATTAMCNWLATHGTAHFTAHIHPQHAVSGRVATAVGLRPTAEGRQRGRGRLGISFEVAANPHKLTRLGEEMRLSRTY